MYTVAREIDLDRIGYTYEDFINDYGDKYENYEEKRTIFNILKTGESIHTFLVKNKVSSWFRAMLRAGFDYNSNKTDNIQNTFGVIYVEYDIDKFRLETYDRHIELYGEKEDIEVFRKKYAIDHPVLFEPYKQEWHLAFDGLFAEYIRETQN